MDEPKADEMTTREAWAAWLALVGVVVLVVAVCILFEGVGIY